MYKTQSFWPSRETIKRLACVTMVRDEEFFLELMLNHYSRMSNDVDFFIIDHASKVPVSDFIKEKINNIHCGRINVIRIPPIPFDDDYKSSSLSSLANMVVAAYDVVIVSDVDEIVIPIGGDLVDIAMRDGNGVIAPLGFEAIHHRSVEGEYRVEKSFTEQRRYGYFRAAESKPVIWKQPNTAGPGLHKSLEKFDFNENLILAHLRYIDYTRSRERIIHRQSVNFSMNQSNRGYGSYWGASVEAREAIFDKVMEASYSDTQYSIKDFTHRVRGSLTVQQGGYYGPDLSISSDFCDIHSVLSKNDII